MIKKLKIKFILISLFSVLFVLVATIASINIYNFVKVENEASNALDYILLQGTKDEPIPDQEPRYLAYNSSASIEVPPEPRKEERMRENNYFVVVFSSSTGEIVDFNFRHTFTISENDGKAMATSIYNGASYSGANEYYRYKKAVRNDNTTIVGVIDIKEKLNTAQSFLIASSIVSSIAYLVLAAIILIVSRFVFKTSEASYKKQKMFITNASHELKTPLTIISTDLDIIELDYGKSEWSESIRDQISRLTTMTNQLVTLSKLEEDNLNNFPFEEFSLSTILKETIETYKTTYEKEGYTFNYDLEENVLIKGNKYLINEMLFILFDNAYKYTTGDKNIHVVLKKNKKDRATLIFENNIEKDAKIDLNLIFERFYRASDAKKEGSGIGLSILKEITDLHKAKVNTSIHDNYLRFEIIF